MLSLLYSPRSAPHLALPLQHHDRNDRHTNHHRRRNARRLAVAGHSQQLGEPEGTNEAPDLTDKGDEDADGGSVGAVAVDGVGDEDGGDDLVAYDVMY